MFVVFFIHHPPDMIVHTMIFKTPVVENWLERNMADWIIHRDRSDDPLHYEQRFYHGTMSRLLFPVRVDSSVISSYTVPSESWFASPQQFNCFQSELIRQSSAVTLYPVRVDSSVISSSTVPSESWFVSHQQLHCTQWELIRQSSAVQLPSESWFVSHQQLHCTQWELIRQSSAVTLYPVRVDSPVISSYTVPSESWFVSSRQFLTLTTFRLHKFTLIIEQKLKLLAVSRGHLTDFCHVLFCFILKCIYGSWV